MELIVSLENITLPVMNFSAIDKFPQKMCCFKNCIFITAILLLSSTVFSQKSKVDSLTSLLSKEKTDSNRVKLMWQIARDIGVYNPDSAQILSHQALNLARRIKYEEGESRSLGILANTLIKIDNYPKALELYIEKLKLEEKRNNPRNMGSVLINIAVVYHKLEDYEKALDYYSKADSVISLNNIEDLKYYINLNIGDTYHQMNMLDSAYSYFNKSLVYARKKEDGDLIGASLTGLGHYYFKSGNFQQSLLSYRSGINYLKAANDDELLCEATLGVANLFEHNNLFDSSAYYAKQSLKLAKKAGFLSKELEAAEFLTNHYKKTNKIDSAFSYFNYVHNLNDSLYSKSKIRESQVISSNEQFRQQELEEERILAKKERLQQLQMLLIAIFIPGFFLLTLFLSRANVHIKLIRVLGILSLLFLFEYLTLLLHPTVARLTHHTPIYEILVFVAIAAILIPMHHRLEHWLIHKLIHHRHQHQAKKTKEPEVA